MVNPDPTNASNLSSGSVPTAQLGNVDTATLEDDIALLGFKVAANGSLAKYNLVDQTVDDFQDTSGVSAGSSTDETRSPTGKYYSGQTEPSGNATGDGTQTTHGSYTVDTFLADGDWITAVAGTISHLIVGGGGVGATIYGAAGGGGGGVQSTTSQSISAGTYAVVVGATSTGAGNDSTFNSVTAGGAAATPTGASGTGGASGSPQSSTGGTGHSAGNAETGGGGGGAGGNGSNSVANVAGGAGGLGVNNDFRTGSNIKYGGGGGGGGATNTAGGAAADGGGTGGRLSGVGVPPAANRGGGGGGNYLGATAQSGAAGVVVIRYITDSLGPVTYNNMTLVSNTTAAQAAPTKGDVVFTYTNGAGTTTLGTDVTAEISADGGSTWTAMTLGSEGSTGSHNIATAHDVTISSTITAPYNMVYRIKTLNQSVSKTTRIQAVSLGWS
jgi:hypothetical protein